MEPQFRNQGIGQALFTYVANQAEENACSRIEWWVSSQNTSASRFYKKLGAIALDEWVIYKCDKIGISKLIEKQSCD